MNVKVNDPAMYSFGPRPKDIIAQAYMPEIKAIKDRKCLVLDQIHFLIFWQGYTCQRGLFLNFNENVELQLGKRALKSWIWVLFRHFNIFDKNHRFSQILWNLTKLDPLFVFIWRCYFDNFKNYLFFDDFLEIWPISPFIWSTISRNCHFNENGSKLIIFFSKLSLSRHFSPKLRQFWWI